MASARTLSFIAVGAAAGVWAAVSLIPSAQPRERAVATQAPAQNQRQPTMCESVALRADRTIAAYVNVPPMLRRQIAPGVYTACEIARQRLG